LLQAAQPNQQCQNTEGQNGPLRYKGSVTEKGKEKKAIKILKVYSAINTQNYRGTWKRESN